MHDTKCFIFFRGDIPQKIFDLIENPGSAAYSALIYGMSRYGEIMRMDELVEECKTAGIPLDMKVYNQLILSTRNRFGVMERRWEQIKVRIPFFAGLLNRKRRQLSN